MDFGSMLDESFAYAKDGIWGKWKRWLLLIGSLIVFPFILGYLVRIYRGEKPAPEPGNWGSLFVDGLKLLLVQLVYCVPVILLVILACLPFVSALITSGALSMEFGSMSDSQIRAWFTGHPEILASILQMLLILLLAAIIAIIIMFFSFLGRVRFARTGMMSEAFNFPAILAHVRRIGWINYILALIIIAIIGVIFAGVLDFLSLIPVFGMMIKLIAMVLLIVPFILFSGRYSALVYDTGEETQNLV